MDTHDLEQIVAALGRIADRIESAEEQTVHSTKCLCESLDRIAPAGERIAAVLEKADEGEALSREFFWPEGRSTIIGCTVEGAGLGTRGVTW